MWLQVCRCGSMGQNISISVLFNIRLDHRWKHSDKNLQSSDDFPLLNTTMREGCTDDGRQAFFPLE